MKRIFTVMMLVVAMMVGQEAAAQDRIIDFESLPKKSQQFIAQYANKVKVAYVKMEGKYLNRAKEFEVKMQDGSEYEFDKRGEWKEVKNKRFGVPTSIVPQNIMAYVAKSFPRNKVVKISRSARKYEVELTNGLDLDFNAKGQFLRIDD